MLKKIVHKIRSNGLGVTFFEMAKLRNRFFNYMLGGRLGVRQIDIEWHGVRLINIKNMEIGEGFSARSHLWIEAVSASSSNPIIHIGRDVKASDNLHIGASNMVTIGDDCLFGSGVLIIDHSHGRSPKDELFDFSIPPGAREIWSSGPISIGKNVWLGNGVIVLPASQIGDGCIIGANSVVRGVLPPNTVWAGNPLRQIYPSNP